MYGDTDSHTIEVLAIMPVYLPYKVNVKQKWFQEICLKLRQMVKKKTMWTNLFCFLNVPCLLSKM